MKWDVCCSQSFSSYALYFKEHFLSLQHLFFLFKWAMCSTLNKSVIYKMCIFAWKIFKVIKINSGVFVTSWWSTHKNCSPNSNGNAAEVLVPKIVIEISSLFFKITGARPKFLLFLGWSPSKGSLCEPFGFLQISATSQERLGGLSFPLQMARFQLWNVL